MQVRLNMHPAYWLLCLFLILIGLTFFGVAVPAPLLGVTAIVAGLFMLATG